MLFLPLLNSCQSAKVVLDKSNHLPCDIVYLPLITTATYTATIDLYHHHITGLLIFKKISDTATRIVFLSETGFKFFDFGIEGDSFKVYYILQGLNHKLLLRTLEQDLRLLLTAPTRAQRFSIMTSDSSYYFAFGKGKGAKRYKVNKPCKSITEIKIGQSVVTPSIAVGEDSNPSAIALTHSLMRLRISLKKLD